MHIDTMSMGLSIVYLNESQVEFSLHYISVLIEANSVDPDEMQHYAAFHLGRHCLPKHPLRVSRLQRV